MTERDWDNFFKIEDFEGRPGNWTPLKRSDSEFACTLANAILKAELDKSPIVYGTISEPINKDGMVFLNCTVYPQKQNEQSFVKSARLVCITELEKE